MRAQRRGRRYDLDRLVWSRLRLVGAARAAPVLRGLVPELAAVGLPCSGWCCGPCCMGRRPAAPCSSALQQRLACYSMYSIGRYYSKRQLVPGVCATSEVQAQVRGPLPPASHAAYRLPSCLTDARKHAATGSVLWRARARSRATCASKGSGGHIVSGRHGRAVCRACVLL